MANFVALDDHSKMDYSSLCNLAHVSRAVGGVATVYLYARVGWPAYPTLRARPDLHSFVKRIDVPQSKLMRMEMENVLRMSLTELLATRPERLYLRDNDGNARQVCRPSAKLMYDLADEVSYSAIGTICKISQRFWPCSLL
jgi:hypothetical protein